MRLQLLISRHSVLIYEMTFRWSSRAHSSIGMSKPSSYAGSAFRPLSHSMSFTSQKTRVRSGSSHHLAARDELNATLNSLQSNASSPATPAPSQPSTWMPGPISIEHRFQSSKTNAPPTTSLPLERATTLSDYIKTLDLSISKLLSLPHMPSCPSTDAFSNADTQHALAESPYTTSVQARRSAKSSLQSILRSLESYVSTLYWLLKLDNTTSAYSYICSLPSHLTSATSEGYNILSDVEMRRNITQQLSAKLPESQTHFVADGHRLLLALEGPVMNVIYVITACISYNTWVTVKVDELTVHIDPTALKLSHMMINCIQDALTSVGCEQVPTRNGFIQGPVIASSHLQSKSQPASKTKFSPSRPKIKDIWCRSYSEYHLPAPASVTTSATTPGHSASTRLVSCLIQDIMRTKESLDWRLLSHHDYTTDNTITIDMNTTVASKLPTTNNNTNTSIHHIISVAMIAGAVNCPTGLKMECVYHFYIDIYLISTPDSISAPYMKVSLTYLYPSYVASACYTTKLLQDNMTLYLKHLSALDSRIIELYQGVFPLFTTPTSPQRSLRVPQATVYSILHCCSHKQTHWTSLQEGSELWGLLCALLRDALMKVFTNCTSISIDGDSSGYPLYAWALDSHLVFLRLSPDSPSAATRQNNIQNSMISESPAVTLPQALASVYTLDLPCQKLKPDFDQFRPLTMGILSTPQTRSTLRKKWANSNTVTACVSKSDANGGSGKQVTVNDVATQYTQISELLHSINYTVLLYASLKKGHNYTLISRPVISEGQLNLLLEHWQHSYYEVDISSMFRRLSGLSSHRGGLTKGSEAFTNIHAAFISTIGLKLSSTTDASVFTDSTPFSFTGVDNSLNGQNYDSILTCFRQVQLSRFIVLYRYDDTSPFKSTLLPSDPRLLVEKLLSLAFTLNTTRPNDTAEVILKLDTARPMANLTSLNDLPSSVSADLGIFLCDDNTGNLEYPASLFQSVRRFVAADTLNYYLQPSSQLTIDSLMVVQQSLAEHDDVVSRELVYEFIAPISKARASPMSGRDGVLDAFITGAFEAELKATQSGFTTKG